MKAILIDHDDSFTYNLRHWLKPLCSQIEVFNHQDFFKTAPKIEADTLVVLSPGPKNPIDYPQTLDWLRSVPKHTPVFGVCLGLQMMAQALEVSVKPYSPPLHGKKSALCILNNDLENLKNKKVARYHSLYCDFESGQNDFEILAVSADDQLPMWVKHQTKKWLGVQFHPESFLTESADLHLQYLNNWLQR
ncbi:MAG: hypothetical protein H7328_12075 [Bdellovibrio sp.]|nr:hypothetical protein [Bdellovibrio sp.]